jgi:hypothetical protein
MRHVLHKPLVKVAGWYSVQLAVIRTATATLFVIKVYEGKATS